MLHPEAYRIIMFGFLVVLVMVGSSLCSSQPRPYVESKQAFSHARILLQKLVPHDERNLSHHEARVHLSGGVIVGVFLAVGNSITHGVPYDPITVIDKVVPAVWEDYNGVVADPVNRQLAELHAKIQTVIAIIDALCPGVDVQTCNSLVGDKVNSNSFLKNRAELLLAIGKVSQAINENERILKKVTSQYTDVPHLFDHIQNKDYKRLAYDIADVYRKVKASLLTH